MVIKLNKNYIEFNSLTEKQIDFLRNYGMFNRLYKIEGCFRLYADRQVLYTALLLLSDMWSMEIISQ